MKFDLQIINHFKRLVNHSFRTTSAIFNIFERFLQSFSSLVRKIKLIMCVFRLFNQEHPSCWCAKIDVIDMTFDRTKSRKKSFKRISTTVMQTRNKHLTH